MNSAHSHGPEKDVRHTCLRLINHELRTPLRIIINNTNLLENGLSGSLSERQQTSVAAINHNAYRLLDLFELIINYADLQAIYRIDTNKDYQSLAPLGEPRDRTIHLDWICDQCDPERTPYRSCCALTSNSVEYILEIR